MRKIILIFLSIVGSNIFQSCEPFDPATVDESLTVVEVPHFFLNDSYCSEFFESSVKSFRVTITVDVVDANGNIGSNHFTKVYNITNDENDLQNNYAYFDDVSVPMSGSYVVTISYDGSASCYSCCGSAHTCITTDGSGGYVDGGKPYFRGVKTLRDQTDVPDRVFINVSKQCF